MFAGTTIRPLIILDYRSGTLTRQGPALDHTFLIRIRLETGETGALNLQRSSSCPINIIRRLRENSVILSIHAEKKETEYEETIRYS